MENKLLGTVLCGGQSKRMGTDKGLILYKGQPWAALMTRKLALEELPYVLSINNTQEENYLEYFNHSELVTDHMDIDGPLNGLMSVHDKYPEQDLLVLACDLIHMQAETITHLLEAYSTKPDFDFYAYHNQVFWEPLCGIYTAKGLKNFLKNRINLSDFSFQHLLNTENSLKLTITDFSSFRNLNTPEI